MQDQEAISSLISAEGRWGRLSYAAWYPISVIFLFFLLIISLVINLSDVLFHVSTENSSDLKFGPLSYFILMVNIIAVLFFVYFDFVCTIKRLHDLNQSGWLSLLKLIPIINFFFDLYLIFRPGDPNNNRYGSPRATPIVEKLFGWLYIVFFTVFIVSFIHQYSFYENAYLQYAKSFQKQDLGE